MNALDLDILKSDVVSIPHHTTQDEWVALHKTILLCRSASRTWLRQSRLWAESKWGAEYVADTEIQLELLLGLPQPKIVDGAKLNAPDKSTAIITIQGIAQSFTLWERKVGDFTKWDRNQLEKALVLLDPISKRIGMLRAALNNQ